MLRQPSGGPSSIARKQNVQVCAHCRRLAKSCSAAPNWAGRRAICHLQVGYALRSELRRCKRGDIASGSQKIGGPILSQRNPASSAQRSQRAVQPSHAAGLYRAAGSWLP
jgi:hypothetical protein